MVSLISLLCFGILALSGVGFGPLGPRSGPVLAPFWPSCGSALGHSVIELVIVYMISMILGCVFVFWLCLGLVLAPLGLVLAPFWPRSGPFWPSSLDLSIF